MCTGNSKWTEQIVYLAVCVCVCFCVHNNNNKRKEGNDFERKTKSKGIARKEERKKGGNVIVF